jgi:hypothetical protein
MFCIFSNFELLDYKEINYVGAQNILLKLDKPESVILSRRFCLLLLVYPVSEDECNFNYV